MKGLARGRNRRKVKAKNTPTSMARAGHGRQTPIGKVTPSAKDRRARSASAGVPHRHVLLTLTVECARAYSYSVLYTMHWSDYLQAN